MLLKDKVAIVTGAGRGIGREVMLQLAQEGCQVVGTARTQAELERVKQEIEESGGKAVVIPLDLGDRKSPEILVKKVIEQFHRIDILINNAGIAFVSDFLDVTEEEFDLTMNVNLKSIFFLCQKALAVMKEQHSGYIINVSSTVALGVPPRLSTYGISKCGVVGLSQALYETAKEFGVKVSIVYPGITDTKMVRDINPDTSRPEQWMLPEDIAGTILFLLKQSDRVIMRDLVPWSVKYDKI